MTTSFTFKLFDTNKLNPVSFDRRTLAFSDGRQNEKGAFGLCDKEYEFIQEKTHQFKDNIYNNMKYMEEDYGFIRSVIKAWYNHHHLIIRPDDIWMALLVQFSFYINHTDRKEKLRHLFVNHKDQKELNVHIYQMDSDQMDSDQIALEFTEKMKSDLKDPLLYDWAIPQFSTTTNHDQAVYAMVLMNSMKTYFKYIVDSSICGIPLVTVEGNENDWKSIKERIIQMKTYDCGDQIIIKWVDHYLLDIADQLILTAQGKPNKEWWKQICNATPHDDGGCTRKEKSGFLNGWITCFCVFDKEGNWQIKSMQQLTDLFNREMNENDSDDEFNLFDNKPSKPSKPTNTIIKPFLYSSSVWPTITVLQIPPGFVNVDLTLNDLSTSDQYNLTFSAGHSGMVYKEHIIRPTIGWRLFKNRNKLKSK